jgi:hypothetical protein
MLVDETLLRAANDCGAGLIVLGVYVHSRFAEMIFGGATLHNNLHPLHSKQRMLDFTIKVLLSLQAASLVLWLKVLEQRGVLREG